MAGSNIPRPPPTNHRAVGGSIVPRVLPLSVSFAPLLGFAARNGDPVFIHGNVKKNILQRSIEAPPPRPPTEGAASDPDSGGTHFAK